MPVYNRMLNLRPYNCAYCIAGYLGLAHVTETATENGTEVVELLASDVNQQTVWNTINTTDPIFVNGFGHGNDLVYTGDETEVIFEIGDCKILSGRIVYLLSCLTANALGPAIINAGAIAYGGYKIEWTWMQNNLQVDPYLDEYAEGFYKASNEFPNALNRGESVAQARFACIAAYNEWIDIWSTSKASDEYAAEVVKWLIWDRDGLVVLGYTDAVMKTAPPISAELSITTTQPTVPIPIEVDGTPESTPFQREMVGGAHTVKVPRAYKYGTQGYAFRQWENGLYLLNRGVWLTKPTTLTARYDPAVVYNLIVDSRPVAVPFGFTTPYDSTIIRTLPFSEVLESAQYTVAFPKYFHKDGTWYSFVYWDDDRSNTTPQRTINLNKNVNATAVYIVVPEHTLAGTGVYVSPDQTEKPFNISLLIDGNPHTMPFSARLPEGPHTIQAHEYVWWQRPESYDVYGRFSHWENGTTNPVRIVYLNKDATIKAFYNLAKAIVDIQAIGPQLPDSPPVPLIQVPYWFITSAEQTKDTCTKGVTCTEYTTPNQFTLDVNKAFALEFPPLAKNGLYEFDVWEDGTRDISPSGFFRRVFSTTTDYARYRAYYKLTTQEPIITVTISSMPQAYCPIYLDGEFMGKTEPSGLNLLVLEGTHKIGAPKSYNAFGIPYNFVSWTDESGAEVPSELVGNYHEVTVFISADKRLTVNYEVAPYHKLSVRVGLDLGLDDVVDFRVNSWLYTGGIYEDRKTPFVEQVIQDRYYIAMPSQVKTPLGTYQFVNWTDPQGNVKGVFLEIDIVVDADTELIANYKKISGPTTQHLSITVAPTGSGDTSPLSIGEYDRPIGEVITLTAKPNAGYTVDYWELDGINKGRVEAITFVMDAPHVAVLHLKQIETKQLIIQVLPDTSYGTTKPLSPGVHTIEAGTSLVVSYQANPGYTIDYWELDGINMGSEDSLIFIMNADRTLILHMKAGSPPTQQVQIIVEVVGEGTTTPPPGTYYYEPRREFKIFEAIQTSVLWRFKKWRVWYEGSEPVEVTDSILKFPILFAGVVHAQAIFEAVEPPTPPPAAPWLLFLVLIGIVALSEDRRVER